MHDQNEEPMVKVKLFEKAVVNKDLKGIEDVKYYRPTEEAKKYHANMVLKNQ